MCQTSKITVTNKDGSTTQIDDTQDCQSPSCTKSAYFKPGWDDLPPLPPNK